MCIVGMCAYFSGGCGGRMFLGCAYMDVHVEARGQLQLYFPKG